MNLDRLNTVNCAAPFGLLLCAALHLVAGCRDGALPRVQDCPAAATPSDNLSSGSGAALAPARALFAAFHAKTGQVPARLQPSIGTKGSIAALADGAIVLALAARRLRGQEQELGIVEHPIARVALAIVTHNAAQIDSVSFKQLSDIYSGAMTTWPNGEAVVPLARPLSDSTTEALAMAYPQLRVQLEQALLHRYALLCLTDQDMRDALLGIPGAIGYLDLGTVRLEQLPLRVLQIDGVQPSYRTLASGDYRSSLQIAWLTTESAPEVVQRFVSFSQGAAAGALLIEADYLPMFDLPPSVAEEP